MGAAAKEMEIPKGTMRGWVEYYSDYLSDNAKPPKGQVKLLDDDDMAVLWTVHYLRAKHKSKSDIADALEDGTLFYPESAAAGGGGAAETETAVSTIDAFTDTLQMYEKRVGVFEDEVRELRERLLDSENKRVAAETELRILKELTDKTLPENENLGFWARLFGKR